MLGGNAVPGIMEWYFSHSMAQSTIDNRNGSNACVFIALHFGLLFQNYGLDNTLLGQSMNIQWQTTLEKAIRDGNQIHEELFDQDSIIVTVDEAIDLAGDQCQVSHIYQEYVFGANPLSQLETAIRSLSLEKSSSHVLVVNEMAMLIIVDSVRTLIFIDCHVHGSKGAVIAHFIVNSHFQAHRFSVWLNELLTKTRRPGLSVCSISSILYS